MKIRILDLDNTIANDEWRIPFIDWSAENKFDRYHKYHSLSAFDCAGNSRLFLNHSIEKLQFAVLTARPQFYQHTTEEWMRRVGLKPLALYMRPNDDHGSSKELKERQILSLLQCYSVPLSAIECCYDDRLDVVEMYRGLGFKAEVRSIHNICAYTNPKEK